MIALDSIRKVGQFNKPHGLQGELSFTLSSPDLFEKADPDYVVCVIDGIAIPFFIEEYRFKSDSTGFMTLDGITSEAEARLMTNLDICLPLSDTEPHESEEDDDIEQLIGYTLTDDHSGPLGTIVDIDLTTINTLLLVKREDKELYIPYAEEYFTSFDPETKELHCLLPDGLISGDYADEE